MVDIILSVCYYDFIVNKKESRFMKHSFREIRLKLYDKENKLKKDIELKGYFDNILPRKDEVVRIEGCMYEVLNVSYIITESLTIIIMAVEYKITKAFCSNCKKETEKIGTNCKNCNSPFYCVKELERKE